jgi:hypothetical protein
MVFWATETSSSYLGALSDIISLGSEGAQTMEQRVTLNKGFLVFDGSARREAAWRELNQTAIAPVCRMDLDKPPCATVEPNTVATLTGECEFVHTGSICHTEEQIAVVWDCLR